MATRRDSAADIAKRFKYDPLRYLIRTAVGKEAHDARKVDIAKELLPYVYPKLRSVEMTSHQLHEIVVKIGQAHVDAPKDVTDVIDDDVTHVIEHAPTVDVTTTSPREQSDAPSYVSCDTENDDDAR